jgi:hypothetical protein
VSAQADDARGSSAAIASRRAWNTGFMKGLFEVKAATIEARSGMRDT